ncbi:DUF934 domain-containing protein [Agrobacterium larrymoorei]|uniref:DUF934 domain-containing protein n=1 Tax=Agrobacterium larrymoorei TaxID=160699 RepID=UPI001573393B|nr:DUF934 domain-containing protein [Agrobacterium larrymoorei]NTJ42335.1 DUF934 domain-containing protein [Agrobacterium larrymoorei]
MTKIWNESGFVDNDPWVIETDEVNAEEGQNAVLPLDAFLTRAAESNDVGLGVLITPADDVTKLEPFIDRIALVAISFPAFNDGRGFSHASLLRSRLNYKEEVRAVGDVLIDQVPLMLRTGFTSFAVTNETALQRLSENRLPSIDVYYQPTAKAAAGNEAYSWRRRLTA